MAEITFEENIKNIPTDEYKYGFADKDVSIYRTAKGINESIVAEISDIKSEPEWMKEFRLTSFRAFEAKVMPTWGANLSQIEFQDFTYYVKPSERQEKNWDDVPETIKNTFDRLGLPEAEQKYLAEIGRAHV